MRGFSVGYLQFRYYQEDTAVYLDIAWSYYSRRFLEVLYAHPSCAGSGSNQISINIRSIHISENRGKDITPSIERVLFDTIVDKNLIIFLYEINELDT